MSDHPGIPAITVFPPFNPAPRRDEPAPEPARDQAPPAAEQAQPQAEPQPEEVPAPAAPMPWDFEAPAPQAEPSAPAHHAPAADAGEMRIGDEDEDLPWLEVPAPREPAEQEIRAEDTPNFEDFARTDDQPPPPAEPAADAGAEDADAGTPPIGDFVADAQPWAPEVENAADQWQPETPAEPWKSPESAEEPWKAPAEEPADAWRAPEPQAPAEEPWTPPASEAEQPWNAPADVDVPEPELYDLPDVPPSASTTGAPWTDAEAPLFEAPEDATEPEPAWELPAESPSAQPDSRPAWESFGAASVEDAVAAEWSAPEAQPEPAPAAQPAGAGADVSAAFAEVADRLQSIADALRSDPAGFVAGAQGGGDPLALLVTGFVLGYQAGRGGNS